MTTLTNDRLFWPNVDRLSIQLSLSPLPIGHFYELALPKTRYIDRLSSSGDNGLCHNVGANPYDGSAR